jgi:hypothetical protein
MPYNFNNWSSENTALLNVHLYSRIYLYRPMDDCSCSEKAWCWHVLVAASIKVAWSGGAQALLPPEAVACIKCLSLLPSHVQLAKRKTHGCTIPNPLLLVLPQTYCRTPFGLSHHSVLFSENAGKSDSEIFRIHKWSSFTIFPTIRNKT